jgi:hypothetical protein|tara:strand:- start:405 stop:530 length:126 start_codon:yes stop_codon:yes gene_type:complete
MKITIELDDHDTNEKHIEKFLKLMEKLITILEDEPKEDGDE